ncbi:hypothetical protein J3R83DRAFT_10376, partial [Lanmaoa asiatica]
GKDLTFKEKTDRPSGLNTRTVEYLDFGKHFTAVQSICGAIGHQNLLVVQEYRDAMESFRSDDTEYTDGACIIGQPGIAPWAPSQSYLLFSAETVTFHERTITSPLRNRDAIWAFSDSNEDDEIPTSAFRVTLGFEHSRRLHQLLGEHRHAQGSIGRPIDLSTYLESPTVNVIFIFGHDVKRMEAFANKFGPVPRTLLKLFRNTRKEAAQEATIDDVMGSGDPSNSGSSAIFFLRPCKVKDVSHRDIRALFVPTHWIVTRLGEELIRQTDSVKNEFFNSMSAHPDTCSAAGWIFEQFILQFLVHGNSITINWCDAPTEPPQVLTLPRLDTRVGITSLRSSLPFCWRPEERTFLVSMVPFSSKITSI